MKDQYVIVEINDDGTLCFYKKRFDSIVDAEAYESSYIFGLTKYYKIVDENDKVLKLEFIQ